MIPNLSSWFWVFGWTQAHEKSATAALLEKDIAVAEASRKVLEIEAEMHSRISILEKKKAISSAQVRMLPASTLKMPPLKLLKKLIPHG